MYHEIKWNTNLVKELITRYNLSSREADLLKKRALKGWTIKQLATFFDVSERTIYRKIDDLNDLYDDLSKSEPQKYSPRVIQIDCPVLLFEYSGKIFFTIDGDEDNIHVIEMEGKTFNSSKKMIEYIYSQVCTAANKKLSEIKEIKFLNNISYVVKINPSN